jgi:TolB-like protein/Tfp pilus assembly protein PilF
LPNFGEGGMKIKKSPMRSEASPAPTLCARCGSRLGSTGGGDPVCLNCLLRSALGEEDVDPTEVPRRYDQYELMVGDDGEPIELGRGAMGVTYKACDTNLRCEVALKVIHPRFLRDESSRARFLSEARAAAQLRHRNIASVFHLGSDEANYFYAMELVEGETLEERVRRAGPIDYSTALDIALQIARALIATGERRFVHRDVKPSNVMLCTEADGAIVAKLIDFGLVRAIAASSSSAGPAPSHPDRGFVGTPHFASPEQFAGKPTDARSDIYSLGITLWFMLTGNLPFKGTREQIQQQQLSGALPLEQLPRLPRGIVDLLKSMLVAEPAKRPQSPAALKDELNKRIVAIDAAHQQQRRRLAYAGLVAAVLMIVGLSVAYTLRDRRTIVPQEVAPPKSVAVLPFQNLSDPGEANASFADGVHEELLTDLSKIADLKVISRTSVLQYRTGIDRNLREIATALGVSHIVEGTVQRAGNRIRLSAQLIDAKRDTHVWAARYDRLVDDVFTVESEIAKIIAAQLNAQLSPSEKAAIEESPTADLQAFDRYTRGRRLVLDAVSFGRSKEKLTGGIELLNQAVARDPTFVGAYAQLVTAHDTAYLLNIDRSENRRALAAAALDNAVRLKPDGGETHLAKADFLYRCQGDYEGALAELRLAERLLPNNADVLMAVAAIDRRQGRWADSVHKMEKALEFDPENFFLLQQIAIVYERLRHFPEMATMLDRALAIRPDDMSTRMKRGAVEMEWHGDVKPFRDTLHKIISEDPTAAEKLAADALDLALRERNSAEAARLVVTIPRDAKGAGNDVIVFPRAWLDGFVARFCGNTAAAKKSFTAARAEVEKTIRQQPGFGPSYSVLGMIDAALGRKDDAIREGERARELLPASKDSVNDAELTVWLALIYAWTGEKDRAIAQLAATLPIPSDLNYGTLRLDPLWDPLRGDQRFEQLVTESEKPLAIK